MLECRVRHVQMFRNMFGGHNAGRMYGHILLAECSSAFSGLWCRRTTLGGESSGRLGTRYVTRARTCFPHSDFIRLPSTQHIPTTVILCLGCLGRVAVRCLGRVVVGTLGVVPSGLSPRGVSSFVHARLGIRGNQGRVVSTLPSLCPHTCSRSPVVPRVPSPRGVEIAFLAGFTVLSFHWWHRAMSLGGMRSRVRRAVSWIRGVRLGWPTSAAALLVVHPDRTPVPDRGSPKATLR